MRGDLVQHGRGDPAQLRGHRAADGPVPGTSPTAPPVAHEPRTDPAADIFLFSGICSSFASEPVRPALVDRRPPYSARRVALSARVDARFVYATGDALTLAAALPRPENGANPLLTGRGALPYHVLYRKRTPPTQNVSNRAVRSGEGEA